MKRSVIYQAHEVLATTKRVGIAGHPGGDPYITTFPNSVRLLHVWLHVNHIRRSQGQKEVMMRAVKNALDKLVWAGLANECHHPTEPVEMNYVSKCRHISNVEDFRSKLRLE